MFRRMICRLESSQSLLQRFLLQHPDLIQAPFADVLTRWKGSSHPPAPTGQPTDEQLREMQLLNSLNRDNQLLAPRNASYGIAHFAGESGSTSLAQFLVSHGISMTGHDTDCGEPLHYAAAGGYLDTLGFLLTKAGGNAWSVGCYGNTLTHLACSFGQRHVLELLRQLGVLQAHVMLRNSARELPVLSAACHGHESCIAYFREHGLDVTVTDHQGRGCCHFAAEQGHVGVLHYFVTECGTASLSQVDKFGATPAHYAARHGRLNVLSYLSAQQVNLFAEDFKMRTPLVWAVLGGKTKRHVECVQFFRENGADFLYQDPTGKNLAQIAKAKHSDKCNLFVYLASFLPST